MRRLRCFWFCLVVAMSFAGSAAAQSPDLAPLLESLRKVAPEGHGHREASYAWAELTAQADADDLPTILAGMDDAGPLAENWLRAAVDAIAERRVQATGQLPVAPLEKFLAQTDHNPRARRLAYEWIARVDETAPDRLIPGMLDDPSLELRRDAVTRLVTTARAAADQDKAAAIATYRTALDAARDLDQVKSITEALDELGAPVDLAHHYGFIVDWHLVGPFDNRGGKGFAAVYPPEESVDFDATYSTPEGKTSWITHHTDDAYGSVDLNKALGKHMGVVGYAAAEFLSDDAQTVDIRIGSENAIKLWLNGKLLFAAEAYHANSAIDQYLGQGQLKPGRNVILVKVCQDEQTVDWAQSWAFQLRVCDASGQAVLSTDRPPADPKPKQPDPAAR